MRSGHTAPGLPRTHTRPALIPAAMGTLAIGVTGLASSAAASTAKLPRLWGYPCSAAISCPHAEHMYKPHTFQLGSHYSFTNVKWTAWNSFSAAATVTLRAQFGGMAHPRVDRTTVVFSHVKTIHGVRYYTRWVSGDGNAQDFSRASGSTYMWYLGAP